MEAKLQLEAESPELVKRVIEVDEDGSESMSVDIEAGEKIKVKIETDRISNMRAGINTMLRLVKTSEKATRR